MFRPTPEQDGERLFIASQMQSEYAKKELIEEIATYGSIAVLDALQDRIRETVKYPSHYAFLAYGGPNYKDVMEWMQRRLGVHLAPQVFHPAAQDAFDRELVGHGRPEVLDALKERGVTLHASNYVLNTVMWSPHGHRVLRWMSQHVPEINRDDVLLKMDVRTIRIGNAWLDYGIHAYDEAALTREKALWVASFVNVFAEDSKGRTALEYAVVSNAPYAAEVVSVLAHKGARERIADDGTTLSYHAASTRILEALANGGFSMGSALLREIETNGAVSRLDYVWSLVRVKNELSIPNDVAFRALKSRNAEAVQAWLTRDGRNFQMYHDTTLAQLYFDREVATFGRQWAMIRLLQLGAETKGYETARLVWRSPKAAQTLATLRKIDSKIKFGSLLAEAVASPVQPVPLAALELTYGVDPVTYDAAVSRRDMIVYLAHFTSQKDLTRPVLGSTPMHYAVMHDDFHVVQILIGRFMATLDVRDHAGLFPSAYIANNAHEMRKLLVDNGYRMMTEDEQFMAGVLAHRLQDPFAEHDPML